MIKYVHASLMHWRHCTNLEDWKGRKYTRSTLDWDNERKEVHLLMSGYVNKVLKQFGHKPPKPLQDQPPKHVPPQYGVKTQYTNKKDDSPPLSMRFNILVDSSINWYICYAINIHLVFSICSFYILIWSGYIWQANLGCKNNAKMLMNLIFWTKSAVYGRGWL